MSQTVKNAVKLARALGKAAAAARRITAPPPPGSAPARPAADQKIELRRMGL
jgi:hypothetical protein